MELRYKYLIKQKTKRIIWLTGKSRAGKSTLAKALEEKLSDYIILEGDSMRGILFYNDISSEKDIEDLNIRLAYLAKILAKDHQIIIVMLTAFQFIRDKIDKIIDVDWIYLKRTVPWKYKKPYEEPDCFTLDIDNMKVKDEVVEVINYLNKGGSYDIKAD